MVLGRGKGQTAARVRIDDAKASQLSLNFFQVTALRCQFASFVRVALQA